MCGLTGCSGAPVNLGWTSIVNQLCKAELSQVFQTSQALTTILLAGLVKEQTIGFLLDCNLMAFSSSLLQGKMLLLRMTDFQQLSSSFAAVCFGYMWTAFRCGLGDFHWKDSRGAGPQKQKQVSLRILYCYLVVYFLALPWNFPEVLENKQFITKCRTDSQAVSAVPQWQDATYCMFSSLVMCQVCNQGYATSSSPPLPA